MTGVAAALCGEADEVAKLSPNGKVGYRRCICSDLSPAASAISAVFNSPIDTDEFARRAEDILEVISNHPEYKKNIVLFSGDSGFYSGSKSFIRDMETSLKKSDLKVSVLPGITSVSYLASKLGESYEDAGIYSLHGRFSKENLNEILWNIKYREKAFVLFSGMQAALYHIGSVPARGNSSCKPSGKPLS